MSIAVSIYDLFAFTIPGFIYLFTLNDLLKALGFSSLSLATIEFSQYWLLIVLLSYLTGQLMQLVCSRLWIRLWYRTTAEERAYKVFTAIYPEKDVEFDPKQWSLLFTMIRREDRPTAEMNDRNMATSIMLRNVSFGLLLFGLLNIYIAFQFVFSLSHLLVAFIMLLLSYISLRRGDFYRVMFFNNIYQHAMYYGKNLNEIVTSIRNAKMSKSRKNS